MSDLAKRLEDDLLRRFPAWRDPGGVLLPPRPRVRSKRQLPLYVGAAALMALLLGIPYVLKLPAGNVVRLGPKVLRMNWPPGFTDQAHLSLSDGRIVLFQGRRVAAYYAGRMNAAAWALTLPPSSTVLAAKAGMRRETAIVVRRSGAVWLQVLSGRGRTLRRTVLWSPAVQLPGEKLQVAAFGPAASVTLRALPQGGWVLSNRDSTWIVLGAGQPEVVSGGSGSLPVAIEGGPGVVTWDPQHRNVSVYTLYGQLLGRYHEPLATGGGSLVPTQTGDGFAIAMGVRYAVPYFLPVADNTAVVPPPLAPKWWPAGAATPAGVIVRRGAALRLLLWTTPGTGAAVAVRPIRSGMRPLALLGLGAVVVGTVGPAVEAVNPSGQVVAQAKVGAVSSIAAGAHFAYAATALGLVQLGPFRTPPTHRALTWTGAAAGWTVTAKVSTLPFAGSLSQPPPVGPGAYVPVLPSAPYGSTLMVYPRVSIRYRPPSGRPSAAVVEFRASLPTGAFADGPLSHTPEDTFSLVGVESSVAPFVWEGIQHGWAVPVGSTVRVLYVQGGRDGTILVRLRPAGA